MAKIDAFFNLMFEQKASDLHLSSGKQPDAPDKRRAPASDHPPLDNDELKKTLYEIAPEYKIKVFEKLEMSISATKSPNISRLGPIFSTKNTALPRYFGRSQAGCFHSRTSRSSMRPLPMVLKKFSMLHRGLIVVTGPTGSGKSTTLAAMVDYANRNRRDHIITVEDPIEFVHESKNCLVNHREVGVHTKSFAFRSPRSLREDPDIILVGELRDLRDN
jgi:twitching motility protein PilT